MNLAAVTADPTLNLPAHDELLQWELRVAKRADELARETPRDRGGDLACWLKAEDEMLASLSALAPASR